MSSESISHPPSLLLAGIGRLATALLPQTLPQPEPERTGPEKLSFSAQLCAAARALETELPPETRLINDPFAAAFAGSEALERIRKRRASNPTSPHNARIALRTRYFDDFANSSLRALAGRPTQFVSLAAGLESRAFRLSGLSKDVSVFEVDVEDVLLRKQDILSSMDPVPVVLASSRTTVIADLSKPGWVLQLMLSGFDMEVPTVWLVEGLLYYLRSERVCELLTEIAHVSAPSSRICVSAITQLKENRSGMASMFISAMPNPREVVTDAGWRFDTVDYVGGLNAHYGRWPSDQKGAGVYVSATKE